MTANFSLVFPDIKLTVSKQVSRSSRKPSRPKGIKNDAVASRMMPWHQEWCRGIKNDAAASRMMPWHQEWCHCHACNSSLIEYFAVTQGHLKWQDHSKWHL